MALTPEDSKAVSKAIQDAMSSAMKSLRAERTSDGGTQRTQQAKAAKVQRPSAGKDKVILAAAGSLKTLEDNADDASAALKGWTKIVDKSEGSLKQFRSGVTKTAVTLRSTRTNIGKIDFSKVADEVSKAIADSIAAGKIETKQPSAGPAVAKFAHLIDRAVVPRLDSLGGALTRLTNLTRAGIVSMVAANRELREAGLLKSTGKPIQTPEPRVKAEPSRKNRTDEQRLRDQALEEQEKARKASIAKEKDRQDKLNEAPSSMSDALEKAFKKMGESRGASSDKVDAAFGKVTLVLGALAKAGRTVADTALQMLDDAFETLAARGYGASGSLFTLYDGAITAGMRLQEYAQLMDENMIAVSRASSFTAFQANVKVGTDALKKFGVFGEDATRLSASMMSASTALGVPQAQMGEAIKAQLGVFEKLRKTTNITAREFAEMTKQLGEDSQVRTELSALAPNEALQRQTAILDQMAYARSLNLSTSEVQKYTAAILAQRKSTVKQRFQQAGRLTQVTGLLGMGGGKAEELRSLAMNKYKTGDQQKRYMALLGEVNTGLEQMQQGGGPGTQYQSDTMREMLDQSGIGQDLEAAAAIRAGKQSGAVRNQDMGKQIGELAQKIGELATTLDGLMKNPFAVGVTALAGTIVSVGLAIIGLTKMGSTIGTFAGTTIARIIGPLLSGRGPGADLPPEGGRGRLRGSMGRVAGVAGGAASAVVGAGMLYGSYKDYQEAEKADDGSEEAKVKKTESAIGGVSGALSMGGGLAMSIAPFLGPMAPFVMAGGAIASGLGMLGGVMGSWLANKISGDSVQEKNTKAVTEATKATNKLIKDGMPTDTLMMGGLGGLGSNLLQTAQASRTSTQGEVQQHLDGTKTREQLMKERSKDVNAERGLAKESDVKAAKEQALAIVKEKTPEGKEVDQKEVDKKAEETLREAALDRVMKARRKAQDEDRTYTSADPAAAAVANSSIVGPKTTLQPEVSKEKKMEGAAAAHAASMGANPGTSVLASLFAPSSRTQATASAPATSSIATPASLTPTTVNSGVVNSTDKDTKAAAVAEAEAAKKAAGAQATAALGSQGVQDPADVLKQILEILKQSLIAETDQVELTSQILRTQALAPSLPDKATMYRRTLTA